MPYDLRTNIYYEVHGTGAPLFLGFPIMASYGSIFGNAEAPVLDAFLAGLTDRYAVLIVDYPSIGRSGDIAPSALTAGRVSDDLLGVARAAGFDRFAWWGYSWGAAAGLQLATRTDRITALAVGGWPPLGAPYAAMLRATRSQIDHPPQQVQVVLREPKQYAQWATFYKSVIHWPEADSIAAFQCPRLVYVGSDGDVAVAAVPIRIASIVRAYRSELESLGWRVVEIARSGHDVGLVASVVLPIVRPFLDEVLF